MAMPKTPDRVDSKSLGKHVKKQDSLPDGSAIAGHQKDFAGDNGHDEDGDHDGAAAVAAYDCGI